MKRIVFSMHLAFQGVDENGSMLLPDKRCFCITEIKGDWAFHKQCFRWNSNWNEVENTCFRCDSKARAGAGDPPGIIFYNLDENPPWHESDLVEFLVRQIPSKDPCALSVIRILN